MDISAELGGRIVSMYSLDYNCNILHPAQIDATTTIGVDKPILRGGSYPLAPYSNRIENAKFNWNNKQYTMPVSPICPPHSIHGISHYSVWQVDCISASKLSLIHTHARDKKWGFDFSLRQTFELQGNKFINTLSFTNKDTTHQPVGLGFHPFFSTQNLQTIQLPANAMWYLQDGIARYQTAITGGKDFNSPRRFKNQIDDLFSGVESCTATYPTHKINIQSPSKNAVLFSNDVNKFFCFEPVENITNAHNMQTNYTTQSQKTYPLDNGLNAIAPNDTHTFYMTIEILSV